MLLFLTFGVFNYVPETRMGCFSSNNLLLCPVIYQLIRKTHIMSVNDFLRIYAATKQKHIPFKIKVVVDRAWALKEPSSDISIKTSLLYTPTTQNKVNVQTLEQAKLQRQTTTITAGCVIQKWKWQHKPFFLSWSNSLLFLASDESQDTEHHGERQRKLFLMLTFEM